MAFEVFQPQLTNAQSDDVNLHGWGHTHWSTSYLDVTMMNGVTEEEAGAKVIGAYAVYHKTMDVDTDDVHGAFDLCNHWNRPELVSEYTVASKYAKGIRRKSMSVGDVLVNSETGEGFVCMPMGWGTMTPAQVKTFKALVYEWSDEELEAV